MTSRILITGGTGTLGRAIVNRYLNQTETEVIVYSRDEQKHEEMKQYISEKYPTRINQVVFFIGDIRDKDRLKLALNANVTKIIHAAALKIVPALELNPMEAVKTNIIGVNNIVECTVNVPTITRVTFVSTDKAVYPINLYGATKLAAEKIILSANNMGYDKHKYNVVRYGNVVGSRGSVIPLFEQLLRTKNTVAPITHLDMTRFWLTIDQAVDLVLNQLYAGLGKLPFTELSIPDMKSFKIVDLIEAMEFKGFKTIGIRPGEKIHESIYTTEEGEKYNFTQARTSDQATKMTLDELQSELTIYRAMRNNDVV